MIPVTAEKLLAGVTRGALPEEIKKTVITGVCTDSRKVCAQSLFVAIKGEKADGHDFLDSVFKNGAAAALVQRIMPNAPAEKQLLVDVPLDAMINLSANYRNGFTPKICAVTGSVGKTTTKQFCYAVFSKFGQTLKTEGNQNNEIGMPNTVFRMDEKTQYAVLEMGMQGLGEIRKLSLAAKPHAAVITCVGHSHLQQLKTRENICRAKMEVCDGLCEGGLLVINGDDEYLPKAQVRKDIKRVTFGVSNLQNDVTAYDIKEKDGGQSFIIKDKKHGEFNAYIPAKGLHNVYNALGAYAAAAYMGLCPKTAAEGLADYETTGFRQNIVHKGDITVIEDCYNANPDSMRAGINTLAQIKKDGYAVCVLGDMLELGEISERAHAEIGGYAADKGADLVICVGNEARYTALEAEKAGVGAVYCGNDKQLALKVLSEYCIGKKAAVLFKASRGIKLEEVMQGFYGILDSQVKK